MSVKIVRVDRGKARIKKALARVSSDGHKLSVGFGNELHEASGMSVAELAAIHEFGAGIIPPRSMIRATFDEEAQENKRKLRILAQAVLDGRITEEKALEIFGTDMAGKVTKRILQGIPPPNAESTIARRGHERTLRESEQLSRSVRATVRPKRNLGGR